MLLELMSNGSLAELPPDNKPDGINMPEEPSVMLLLPHNKYLLGTGSDKWIFASSSDKQDTQPQNVFLYEDQVLSLINEGASPTILTAGTVNALRKELFSLSEPPGRHSATVLMLKTFMKDRKIFASEDLDFVDEKIFAQAMKNDSVLYRAYWALRFALARSEMETVGRLKAWLKAGPEIFQKSSNIMKLWFSLSDYPQESILNEFEELNFSRLEIKSMSQQHASPLLVYNPMSGWLILGKFGRVRDTMFIAWVYLNHELYGEMRTIKKLSVHDIILAAWGEYETQQAVIERAKYKGDD